MPTVPAFRKCALAVRENQLSAASVSKVETTADWIFENATFWVWEEAGAVQGFSVADPRDGTIFGLFIHPDYEGRGLGRALLPLACEDLRAAGFAVATLTTGPGTRAERSIAPTAGKRSGVRPTARSSSGRRL